MNKALKNYFEEHGLSVNQNKGFGEAYGAFDGYEATFVLADASTLVARIAFFAEAEQRATIMQTLISRNSAKFLVETTENGVMLRIKLKSFAKTTEYFAQPLAQLVQTLNENGALGVGYCPTCGKQLDFDQCKRCNLGGANITLCNDCVETLNSEIRAANEEFDSLPNNYLRGFAGAVLGALVGCALAVVLYLIGFVSALSSVVAVLLGAVFFQKFGGKPNKIMLVIVCATSAVMMLLATFVIYVVACKLAADEAGMAMSALEAFAHVMQDEEFARTFYGEMAMTALFTAIGCGVEIFELSRKIRRQKDTF